MEILMDFDKPSISKNLGKFLLDNLKTEKERESLNNMITGKALLKVDAIMLLRTILQAMTVSDNFDDEELSVVTPEVDGEDGDEGEKSGLNSSGEFPTLAQSMTKWSLVENNGKKPAQKINELLPSGSNTNPILTGDELLHKFENTCYFYKLGKCKFGKECKKEHPKFCQKFINNGPIKLNTKGCDNKCNNLHPIACRDSIKSIECVREKCRFYHLKGTKKPATVQQQQFQSQFVAQVQSQPINQAVPPTQVQVQPVSTPIFNPVPAHQVYYYYWNLFDYDFTNRKF